MPCWRISVPCMDNVLHLSRVFQRAPLASMFVCVCSHRNIIAFCWSGLRAKQKTNSNTSMVLCGVNSEMVFVLKKSWPAAVELRIPITPTLWLLHVAAACRFSETFPHERNTASHNCSTARTNVFFPIDIVPVSSFLLIGASVCNNTIIVHAAVLCCYSAVISRGWWLEAAEFLQRM